MKMEAAERDAWYAEKGVLVARAEWQKSSRSGPYTDNCVEVAFVDGAVAMRDSKNPDGTVLLFTPTEWDAFIGGAKDGEFEPAG